MLQVVLTWTVVWLLAALLLQFARRAAAARRYWAERGVPHVPPCPVFGSMRDAFLQRIHADEVVCALYRRFPDAPVVGLWRMQSPALLLRDPALVPHVFIAHFAHFPHRGVRVDERADPLTTHLVALSDARWRPLRVRLTAFSSTGRLRAMVPAIARCAEALQAVVRGHEGRPLNAYDLTARYTTDVIGACVFGMDFSALASPEGSVLRAYGRRVANASLGLSTRRALRLFCPRIAHALRLRQFPADVCDFFLNFVSSELDRRERILSEGKGEAAQQRVDLMQLLLEIRRDIRSSYASDEVQHNNKKPQEAALTEDLLAAQAFVFFLAGFDSPASNASHCLYELARHPHVQRAARADVLRALGSSSSFTYDALQDMTYLDMVIHETLRLHPVTGTLMRECERETRLPAAAAGVTVQPGTMVMVSVLAMHLDERHFPQPLLFRPERFSPQERPRIKPYTYMPFGVGPRTCVGERFAQLQMKMALAHLLLAFEVQPCADTPHELLFDPAAFALRSKQPLALRFLPRDHTQTT